MLGRAKGHGEGTRAHVNVHRPWALSWVGLSRHKQTNKLGMLGIIGYSFQTFFIRILLSWLSMFGIVSEFSISKLSNVYPVK